MTSHGAERRLPTPEGWLEYAAWRGERGTITGRVLVRPRVRSEALGNERHILVHLPPSLVELPGASVEARRYPVLYMHDGQNLFDAGTSDHGEWRVDETMVALSEEGYEAIIVAIPNAEAADPPTTDGRPLEYGPYVHDQWGGRGGDYLDFVSGEVKPLIDRTFPTLPDPSATGLAGSSLGGLISLYGLATRPHVFGFAGVISPAMLFGRGRVLHADAPAIRPGRRIYVDVGGREGEFEKTKAAKRATSRRYLTDARALRKVLLANGFVEGDDFLYLEVPEAIHHQSAWAARMPSMLRFLLRPWHRA